MARQQKELTKEHLEVFLSIAAAVDKGAKKYDDVIKKCRRSGWTLSKGEISKLCERIASHANTKSGKVFGLGTAAYLEIDSETEETIDWAWRELSSHLGWQETLEKPKPSRSQRHDIIRITTENFLASHLISKLEANVNADRQPAIWFEIRECPTLFAGLDDHRRNETDFLLHTVRSPPGSGRPSMPKIEGITPTDFSHLTGFELHDAVWIPPKPKKNEADYFEKIAMSSDGLEAEDLDLFPVAFVDLPDAAGLLMRPKVMEPRVLVETNEAMRYFVRQNKYVGIGHDWPPVSDERSGECLRVCPFQTDRPPIKIGVFYRDRPKPSKLARLVLENLESVLKEQVKPAKEVKS